MSSQIDSTQAAEIQSVTKFEVRTMGDMGRFLAKITANDAALAPYVEHIIFTPDVFPMSERPAKQLCEVTVKHEEAQRKGDTAVLENPLPYSDTCSPACGIGCLLGREWSICKNIRSITLPLEWATADLPGHKHFWQYFDIQTTREYEYKYRGKWYFAIGDPRPSGSKEKETGFEHFVARQYYMKSQLSHFSHPGSNLPGMVQHLIIDCNPRKMTTEQMRQALSCHLFSPSLEEVQAMGIAHFMTSAVEAMFKGRNKIHGLIVPVQWAQYFESSGAFPSVDWSMKYEAWTETSHLLVVGDFRQTLSELFAKGHLPHQDGALTTFEYQHLMEKDPRGK
jgi:hypothetical protein